MSSNGGTDGSDRLNDRYIDAYVHRSHDGSQDLIRLSTPRTIYGTPPSKAVRNRLAHFYDLPADELTCLHLQKREGHSYGVFVSDDPVYRQIKKKSTNANHTDAASISDILGRMNNYETQMQKLVTINADLKEQQKNQRTEFDDQRTQFEAQREQFEAQRAQFEAHLALFELDRTRSRLRRKPLLMYGAATHAARNLDPRGSMASPSVASSASSIGADENIGSFRVRIDNAIVYESPDFRDRKLERPCVVEVLNPKCVARLFDSIDIDARHAEAHPNLHMPSLISDLLELDAIEWAETFIEGTTGLALRTALAASPKANITAWMSTITSDPVLYPQPTAEQLQRFGKFL